MKFQTERTIVRGVPFIDFVSKAHGILAVELTLAVHYTPGYPDELPELALKYDDAKVSEQDEKKLLTGLLKVVCCYTGRLASHDSELSTSSIRGQKTWEWQ